MIERIPWWLWWTYMIVVITVVIAISYWKAESSPQKPTETNEVITHFHVISVRITVDYTDKAEPPTDDSYETYEVTAYTAGVESTGKTPSHPEYVIIRVNCPDDIRLQRAKDAGDTFNTADITHDTESHVNSFAVDYDIDNDGSLAELYAQVDVIMAEVSA